MEAKKSRKEDKHDWDSNPGQSGFDMKCLPTALREQLISTNYKVSDHQIPITPKFKSHLFVENRKIQLMPKIMNHLFTYYLNCVGKSDPVCLIRQLPLVILLASYVQ